MWLQKLGGRKFLLALISMGIGTGIELYTTRGVSASFASLLAGLVAAFSASNYLVTKKHMETTTKPAGDKSRLADMHQEIVHLRDDISDLSSSQPDTEVKETLAQVGQAVVNCSQKVDNTNKLLVAAMAQSQK